MHTRKTFLKFVAVLLFVPAVFSQQPQHLFFRVTLGPQLTAPVSGRLLIFLKEGTGAKEVDANPFQPSDVSIAAKELYYWKPGTSVDIDTDELAFPAGFSALKPGNYDAQAVLDVNHNYNYSGRSAGDLVSDVVSLRSWTPGQGSTPDVTLSSVVPERTPRTTALPRKAQGRRGCCASRGLHQSFPYALLGPGNPYPGLGHPASRILRPLR